MQWCVLCKTELAPRPVNFKDADILSHAVCSRLQLVRDKVVFRKEWSDVTGYMFVEKNWDLLKTIRMSVSIAH